MPAQTLREPKYRQVHDSLLRQILAGRVGPGGRLPSEADLVVQYGASRITIARALRELQMAGLVERRAGSGTYVRPARGADGRALVFGMLMPDFGAVEVLSGICRGMIEAPEARAHTLAWAAVGDAGGQEGRAWRACQQYIDRRVDGVFFVPFEYLPDRHALNRRIADALDAARIPLVLIDRSIDPFPRRGRHDLVGLDNRRAGALVTEHLLDLGCERTTFIGLPGAASTVDAREAGYREVLGRHGLPTGPYSVLRADPADGGRIETLMGRHAPDGIACASDRTAGLLMRTLLDAGFAIPDRVRLVGVDDVEYAPLLPVPLTTLRQPLREIGVAAMAAMVERVANPSLPPRDILLHGRLVVRRSCGGPLSAPPEARLEAGELPG
jgi:GntR family transcriptional regulator, arabinose operon transcriptional repressor